MLVFSNEIAPAVAPSLRGGTPSRLAIPDVRTAKVALFAKLWTAICGLGLGARVATVLAVDATGDELWRLPMRLQVMSVAPVALLWMLARAPGVPGRAIASLEMVALALHAGLLALMGGALALDILAEAATREPLTQIATTMAHAYCELIVVFVLGGALVLRSAIVPERAERAAALTAVMGAMSVVGFAVVLAPHASSAALGSIAVGGLAFWTVTVAIVTAMTHALHGLRKEIREAKKLGPYTLEGKLGEGGMGVVYRARHAMLRRPTAVKLLRASRVGERALRRFEREVRATARLTHPNTVTVFDYGRTDDGTFFYAMELLDGLTLEALVEQEGPQPPARVVHIAAAVCGALAEAHDQGLIHRDVKPSNVLLTAQGGVRDTPKVVDFGLVKEIRQRDGLTADDTVTGTPMYMAPELITAPDAVDGRADIYALAAMMFYLLTAETVFAGSGVLEVCGHHLHTAPEAPSARGVSVPPELDALILRNLAKTPEARATSAAELQRELLALPIPRWRPASPPL